MNSLNRIKITDIIFNTNPNKDLEPLQSIVSIVLNGRFLINSIKIFKGKF